jgi:hypothetical protein
MIKRKRFEKLLYTTFFHPEDGGSTFLLPTRLYGIKA